MRSNKGFTLIEVVISLAVISISVVVLIGALSRSIAAAANNSVLTDAVMLGSEKLTVITSGDFPDQGNSDWQTDERYPRFRFRKVVSVTPLPDVVNVKMEVEHDKKFVFDLQAYMVKKAS